MAIVEQLHTTRIAFYTALYNESLRALGEAQRTRLAENVTTQSERYRAGQTNRAAIMSAQLLERELEPRIQEVQRGYEGAVLTLATAMGDMRRMPCAPRESCSSSPPATTSPPRPQPPFQSAPISSSRASWFAPRQKISGSSRPNTIRLWMRPSPALAFQ